MPEPAADHRPWLPALALTFNAFTWGVSWWPFRQLQAHGLHPLWATALIYTMAMLAITLWRPRAWAQLFATPALWWLVLAAGATNATFNWAVTVGDVVRVVLLFYLMPLWAVLLARVLLDERLTPRAGLQVALALAGAAVVLWPADAFSGGLPVPRTLAEWLSVAGGFTFALNNVLLRREAHQPETARALAMFTGGALVAGVLAASLSAAGSVPWPPLPAVGGGDGGMSGWVSGWVSGWIWGAAAALSAWFLLSNPALQFGAARLPASVTAVVLITEVLFASVSALLLGAGTLTLPLAAGGALIVAATLLSARPGAHSGAGSGP